MRSQLVTVFGALLLSACPAEVGRSPGDRRPLSAECDALDPTRCLLPWPSNTFTRRDDSSPTGLRLELALRALPIRDAPTSLNRVDGFSVATPLAFGFSGALADGLSGQRASPVVRLFVAQPGASFGEEILVRLHVVAEPSQRLLLAWPHRPLAFGTDYVAVVLDDAAPGTEAPREVAVAVGAAQASDDRERALFEYHAPTRTLLQRAQLAATRVLRVTEFTTRSAEGHAAPWEAMRAAALAVPVQVSVTSATLRDGGVEVHGEVSGLATFRTDAGVLGPESVGDHTAPFRAVLPAGAGPLPVVLFGHGTGSSVEDPDLDDELLATGAAKLNLEFAGWTHTTTAVTFVGFERTISGTERSTAGLAQSLLDASALEAALEGPLGAALTAPQLAGVTNPAAGRTLDASRLAWFGSSLGGTLGFAHTLSEPRVKAAVLNVPGAGCTQFLQLAEQWQQLDAVFSAVTPSAIDRALGLVLSQTNWDLVDGAVWSAHPARLGKPILIQESIGDPVLPNVGSELVATSARAVPVGAPIVPLVFAGDEASGASITQFQVPAAVTDSGAVHAFVTRDTPAGLAARPQLGAFFSSVWAGAPRAEVPALCAARAASCDFSR